MKKLICIIFSIILCLGVFGLFGCNQTITHTADYSGWETSVTEHWRKCKCGCNMEFNKGEHTFNGMTCSTCGAELQASTDKLIIDREGETSLGNFVVKGIRGDKSAVTEIVIPRTYEGNIVRGIGTGAFQGATNLKKVIISDNVTAIGISAFSDCTALTSVNIPNSVESIGENAFFGCTSLKKVNIPTSLDYAFLGYGIFSGCTSLETVDLPNNMKRISEQMFANCTSLKDVVIKDEVTMIEKGAFYGCSAMKTLRVGASVTYVGENALNTTSQTVEINFVNKKGWKAGSTPIEELSFSNYQVVRLMCGTSGANSYGSVIWTRESN